MEQPEARASCAFEAGMIQEGGLFRPCGAAPYDFPVIAVVHQNVDRRPSPWTTGKITTVL
jgi:hypothetical protein